jgi:hypothetical protein
MNHYSMEKLARERNAEARDWARRTRLGREAGAPPPSTTARITQHLRSLPRQVTSRVAMVAVRIGTAARG